MYHKIYNTNSSRNNTTIHMNTSSNPLNHKYYGVYSNVHLVVLLSSMLSDSGEWAEELKSLQIQPLLNYPNNRTILILNSETKKIDTIYQIENFLTLSTVLFQYGTPKDSHISAIMKFLFETIPKLDSNIINLLDIRVYYYMTVDRMMKLPYTSFVKNSKVTALGTVLSSICNEYVSRVQVNSEHEWVWMDEIRIQQRFDCYCIEHKNECLFHQKPSGVVSSNQTTTQLTQTTPPNSQQTSSVPSGNTSAVTPVNVTPLAPITNSVANPSFPNCNQTANFTSFNNPFTNFQSGNGFVPTLPASTVSNNSGSSSSGSSFTTSSSFSSPSSTLSYQNIFNKPSSDIFSNTSSSVNIFTNSTTNGFSKPNPFLPNKNPFSSGATSNNTFGQKFNYKL